MIPLDGHMQLHPDERPLNKSPLHVKVEDASISIDPMSRLNFSKVFTVGYNHKVRNVGRMVVESVKRMEEYFAESLGLSKD